MSEQKPSPGPAKLSDDSALPTFDREWQTFQRELPGLLAAGNEGPFAVIKGDDLIGIWDTEDDALDAGYERLGVVEFLVQPVLPPEKEPIYRAGNSWRWQT
jgi:hypothetical protein